MNMVDYIAEMTSLLTAKTNTGDGEVPFYPELGKYRPLAIPVDDPNLGPVTRKFGIHIPEQYSPDKKVEVSTIQIMFTNLPM